MSCSNGNRGFTLIEMLVALVVGGLLMASLVALSGSVQRSFGRSKEITDMQNDLRYAIKMIASDMSRAGLMHSPNPQADFGKIETNTGGLNQGELASYAAIRWNPPLLELYGNFVSARDYLWNRKTKEICCRNGVPPSMPEFATCNNPFEYYERYLLPFADGPSEVDYVFCPGVLARVRVGQEEYAYHRVQGVSDTNLTVTFTADPSPDEAEGETMWINPVNLVQYQMIADDHTDYKVRYDSPTDAAERWQLYRRLESCRDGVLTMADELFVAEYLLPPNGPRAGLEVALFEDNSAALGAGPGIGVDIDRWPDRYLPDQGLTIDYPQRVRGVTVTLRGRSRTEDPEFVIPDYTSDEAAAMRFGVDLDGEPANGLAHVREMTTVVEIPNLLFGSS